MRLLITGGGTGGHIYPALAIAQAALGTGAAEEVLFVGARGGMEERLVADAGLPLRTLPVRGLIRKRPLETVAGVATLGRAIAEAARILREFDPQVVVGTGGYAAGPVGLAAVLARRPLLLQEQNVIPGVTNRALARFAVGVAVPYPEAARHFPRQARILVTGNPLRPELRGADPRAARRALGLPAGPVVLMVAGSRGSEVFTRLFGEWLPSWAVGTLVFVSGRAHHARAHALLQRQRGAGRVVLLPYLADMPAGLAAADLVVCRAGAMTLAELAAARRPAVLIPSPHVTHHHQEANAQVFGRAGAAVVLAEAGLDGAGLGRTVSPLLQDVGRRETMARAAGGLDHPASLEEIVAALAAAGRGRRRAP